MNYFRITAYDKTNNYSFIIDSYGRFEHLWQFSSYLLNKSLEIVEVSKQENMLDVNIKPIKENAVKLFLRAYTGGEPEQVKQMIEQQTYNAIKVSNMLYIPHK